MKRDLENKMIAGVCSGIAKKYGFNRTLVRFIFAFLLFPTLGTAIFAYLLCMIVMRAEKPENVANSPDMDPDVQALLNSEDIKDQATLVQSATDLLDRVAEITSFEAVKVWDEQASRLSKELKTLAVRMTEKLEELKTSFPNAAKAQKMLQVSTERVLEVAEKLEDWVDRTPDSRDEAKELISNYKLLKKELTLDKKEVLSNMREVRDNSRDRMTRMSFASGKTGRFARDVERMSRERGLSDHRSERDRLDSQILAVDRRILWLERISKS